MQTKTETPEASSSSYDEIPVGQVGYFDTNYNWCVFVSEPADENAHDVAAEPADEKEADEGVAAKKAAKKYDAAEKAAGKTTPSREAM